MTRGPHLSILVGLSFSLSACGFLGVNKLPRLGNSINVVLELPSDADQVEQSNLKNLLGREVQEFKRLNPQLPVRFRAISSDRLQQELRFRNSRGLAPDLVLLLSSRPLLSLYQGGLATPVSLSQEERRHVPSWLLKSLEHRGHQLGLPLLMKPTLACFHRSHLKQAPRTLSDLLGVARAGSSIGLHANLTSLDWLFSGFGVAPFPSQGQHLKQQGPLNPALQWLYRANLEPFITFVSTDEELRRGLAEKRFVWIPCSSGWIPTLRQSLGADLGIAILPAGPAGPARPLVAVQTWMFGPQSSPTQRRLAKQFAFFTLNPIRQRMMGLQQGTGFPVNPAVTLPLKAYPVLSVMATSLGTSTSPNPAQYQFLSINAEKISSLTNQLLAGTKPPQLIVPDLQHLLDTMPRGESQHE